jgi:hypothetical protein
MYVPYFQGLISQPWSRSNVFQPDDATENAARGCHRQGNKKKKTVEIKRERETSTCLAFVLGHTRYVFYAPTPKRQSVCVSDIKA